MRSYSVIYKVVEELRAAMEGLLEPEDVKETVGTVEMRRPSRPQRSARSLARWSPRAAVRRGATGPVGSRRHDRL